MCDTLKVCSVCHVPKPRSEFPRVARSSKCRVCYNAARNAFRKSNRKVVAGWEKRYKTSTKGRKKTRSTQLVWSRNNSYRDSLRHAEQIASLANAYIRGQLRSDGITNPTAGQIAARRRRIQVKRARKTIAILSYGGRT
jgi:hypothetical protein